MSATDGLTWEQLMALEEVEQPFDRLWVDPIRWNPDAIERRLLKITNSLMVFRQEYAKKQGIVTKLGVRTGDEYKGLRSEVIMLEEKIEALRDKRDVLRELMWNKRNEHKEL